MQHVNVSIMDLQLLRKENSDGERAKDFSGEVTFTYHKNFVSFFRCLFS